MEVKEETEYLRKLIEEEDAIPVPSRLELGESYYEFDVVGKFGTAKILIQEADYYSLLGYDDFQPE